MDEQNGRGNEGSGPRELLLPFETSVGYQIRLTHRLIQRYLQQKIAPYGITLGMWYFLRVLWHQDGLTHRELSTLVGTMEPTTLDAIKTMEAAGLVRRERNYHDRRKINVFLTPRGRRLERELMPLAKEVVEASLHGFSETERSVLLTSLAAVQRNIRARIDEPVALTD